MNVKQILATTLAAATLFTMSGPALADKGHKGGEHGKALGHYKHEWKNSFGDLQDAAWAQVNIEKAMQLGLMVGIGQGRFNPHAPITREAAITTAIRLMGLQDQASTHQQDAIHFTDANKVDSWARGSVALAVSQNLLPPEGDGMLRPTEPASRLWVSVLLVKALGYDAEAQASMTAQLPFKDASEIPADLVGYVATAVSHKLVSGYEDATFKPNKPVTRAEMAALLGRSDDNLADRGERKGEMHGTVQAIDATAGTMTVQGAHGSVSGTLTSTAAIFVDNKPAEATDIKTGMTVWVKLDADLQITLVDAHTATTPVPTTQTVQGKVAALTVPSGTTAGSVTITPDAGGSNVTATVTSSVTVTQALYDGTVQNKTLADITVGTEVQATITSGTVTTLKIVTPAATTVQGKVMAYVAPSGSTAGTLVFLADGAATATTYSIATTATVTQGTTTKSFADLSLNLAVKLTLSGNTVTGIQILP